MFAAMLIAVGFRGLAIVAGIFLFGGGYLGFKYGASVERRAAAALSKAGSAASSASQKV